MKVNIPVYYSNEYNESLEDLGIETDIRNSDIRDTTFFNIDYVSSWFYDGVEFGLIGVNHEALISPMSKEQILKLIDEQK